MLRPATISFFVLCVYSVGCSPASSSTASSKLHTGMSQADILRVLGTPTSKITITAGVNRMGPRPAFEVSLAKGERFEIWEYGGEGKRDTIILFFRPHSTNLDEFQLIPPGVVF